MKRFMIATALTATMSTAAFAATEAEMAQIKGLVPDVDVSALSDAQVAEAMAVIAAGESRGDKIGTLRAMLGVNANMTSVAMPTEAQRAEIENFVTGVDYSTVTQAQLDTAMAYIKSDMGRSNIQAGVRSVLIDDGTPVGTTNTATASEMAILQRYIPAMAVETLTESELNTAMAIVYSGSDDSEIQSKLQAFVDS